VKMALHRKWTNAYFMYDDMLHNTKATDISGTSTSLDAFPETHRLCSLGTWYLALSAARVGKHILLRVLSNCVDEDRFLVPLPPKQDSCDDDATRA